MIHITAKNIAAGSDIIIEHKLHLLKSSGILHDIQKKVVTSDYIYIAYLGTMPIGCSLSSDENHVMVFVKPGFRRLSIGTTLAMYVIKEGKYKDYLCNVDTNYKYKKSFWKHVKDNRDSC